MPYVTSGGAIRARNSNDIISIINAFRNNPEVHKRLLEAQQEFLKEALCIKSITNANKDLFCQNIEAVLEGMIDINWKKRPYLDAV